jgi:hypothetical protein
MRFSASPLLIPFAVSSIVVSVKWHTTQIYAKVLTIQNYFYFVYNINLGGFANVLALIAVAAIF